MPQFLAGFGFALLCALVVIVADAVIKLAADSDHSVWSGLVFGGSVLYAMAAVLWFYAMQHVSLVQAGVAYSMLSLIALAIVGVLFFGETLHTREYLGLGLAVASMALLSRFA